MCKHDFIKQNDVKVCRRCGLTVLPNGSFFYDKKILARRKKKK